jgi:hypothetical protein
MGLIWLAGLLRRDNDYQPRHRSPRREAADDELGVLPPGLSAGWYDDLPAWDSEQAGQRSEPVKPGLSSDAPARSEDDQSGDFLDQLTIGEIRRILEGCAVNDPAEVVPDLVGLIAHSSHTPDTLLQAWAEFEEATRDVFALQHRSRDWSAFFSQDQPGPAHDTDPVAVMRLQADEAWRHITCGLQPAATPAAACAPH